MIDRTVQIYQRTSEFLPIFQRNTYELVKTNKPIQFLIKLLLKYKLIKEHIHNDINFRSVPLNLEKVKDMAREQIRQLERNGYRPNKIILGRKAMHELMCDSEQYMSYSLTGSMFEGSYLYGYEIILHPFMDGTLVI